MESKSFETFDFDLFKYDNHAAFVELHQELNRPVLHSYAEKKIKHVYFAFF